MTIAATTKFDDKNRQRNLCWLISLAEKKHILPLHETGDDPLIATFGRYTALGAATTTAA